MKRTIVNINFTIPFVKYLPKVLRRKLPSLIKIVSVRVARSELLNRVYRSKNAPANVLSFRYGPDYGEILVCPEMIRREAKEQGNTYKYQMTWMIIHGMLHLAGVHHEKSKAMHKKFGRIEKTILRKLF